MYYYAYGSNLHPLRLSERVPSARLVGRCSISGYRLLFHKQGADGSGKCNLLKTGMAGDSVHGALYTLQARHKQRLDQFEGRGHGYLDHPLEVSYQGKHLSCFTYLAQQAYIQDSIQPYHWYKELVIQGARYLQFPDAYIAQIDSVGSRHDPESDRNHLNEELLKRIRDYAGAPNQPVT